MRAIDTNVLIRLILLDDPLQNDLARAAIAEAVLVPVTVLLETGWVLSSRYRLARSAVAKALLIVLDFPTIHVLQEDDVRWALDRYAHGADLADMLHIVAAGDVKAFRTFDRAIVGDAGPNAPIAIETL